MILQKKHITSLALIIGLLLVVSGAGLSIYSYQQRQVNDEVARSVVAKLQAVASSNDMTEKAEAFVEHSKILTYSFLQISSDKKKEVRAALTSLMLQDASAMMTALDDVNHDMKALILFLQDKFCYEEFIDISHLFVKLRFGNDLSKTEVQFLEETQKTETGKEVFVNQKNLGIFYGSLVAGIEQATKVEKERGHIASNILKGIAKLFAEDKLKNVRKNILPEHYADMIDQDASKWSVFLHRFATVQKSEGGRETVAGDHVFGQASDSIILKYRTSQ